MKRQHNLLTPILFAMFCFGNICCFGQETETESDPAKATETETKEQQDLAEDANSIVNKVKELILNGDIRDAIELIESRIADDADEIDTPGVQRSYAMVIAGFNRTRNVREVYKTLNQLFEFQMARLEKSDDRVRPSGTVRSILAIATQLGKQDEVADVVDKAIAATLALPGAEKDIPLVVELSNLRNIKAQSLVQQGKRSEAIDLFEAENLKIRKLQESSPDDETVMAVYARSLSNLMRLTEDMSKRDRLYEEHQQILQKRINTNPESMSFAAQYLSALIFKAGTLLQDEPNQALEVLGEGEKVLGDVILANKDAERALQPIKAQMAILKQRAEGQLVIDTLIDKPAPEFDVESWINGDELQKADLEGKLILVNFWAIGFGPCVETFPHLKKLLESYGDQGLQIVGATRHYNFAWDSDKGGPVRGRIKIDPEEENDAIRLFMEKHDLPYPSMVMSEKSTMGTDFGVTGIPHFVLIGRDGIVRLVRVGGTEKTVTEIEEKIKELLAE